LLKPENRKVICLLLVQTGSSGLRRRSARLRPISCQAAGSAAHTHVYDGGTATSESSSPSTRVSAGSGIRGRASSSPYRSTPARALRSTISIPTDNYAEIEALAGSNPSFAAFEQNEPYTIALLLKGRSGGASTKHLYRSVGHCFQHGDHILWLSSGTTPNLRHQASSGTVTITSSVAIVNDTTWSTIVGTWRPGRLELYVDGFSRTSSTAAATTTRALSGIYRWGWGFSTSQDFKGDIALIACFASSWTPAMVRRWHADPFGFLRCRRSWGVRRPPRPHQPARAWSPS
jgi:Concanavalin A-like lectin/glucanases superfamily